MNVPLSFWNDNCAGNDFLAQNGIIVSNPHLRIKDICSSLGSNVALLIAIGDYNSLLQEGDSSWLLNQVPRPELG